MELCCSSNSIKGEEDVAHSGPPVKFVDSCLILSGEPNISDPSSCATTAKADAGRHDSFQGVDLCKMELVLPLMETMCMSILRVPLE
jgi:hypothetical protein